VLSLAEAFTLAGTARMIYHTRDIRDHMIYDQNHSIRVAKATNTIYVVFEAVRELGIFTCPRTVVLDRTKIPNWMFHGHGACQGV
jgi:hypothetical protein